MPITDPDVRRQRQAAWERCRQRALKNLARIHYEEYRELLDVERAKEGINKLGYNGRVRKGDEEAGAENGQGVGAEAVLGEALPRGSETSVE